MVSTNLNHTMIPDSMNAWRLEAFGEPYTLRKGVTLPGITGQHDLLIKVDAASFCHTDAILASGAYINAGKLPIVGCHEFAGTVVKSACESFQLGERVGVPGRAYRPCGTCAECRAGPADYDGLDGDGEGYSIYCSSAQSNGLSKDGGFQEYTIVDARQVVRIPSSISAVQTAPLMCAGITIYQSLKRCNLKPGQSVGIIGCGGGLGHLGLQFASKMGLRVVGIDTADDALKLAESMESGALIADPRKENAEDVIRRLSGAQNVKHLQEAALDAVIILPESQQAFEYGMSLLKNHGKCVIVSFPKDGFNIRGKDVVFRDISIVGSLVGSNRTMHEMLDFVAHHNITTTVKTYKFEQLNDLVDDYHRGSVGKLVLDMTP